MPCLGCQPPLLIHRAHHPHERGHHAIGDARKVAVEGQDIGERRALTVLAPPAATPGRAHAAPCQLLLLGNSPTPPRTAYVAMSYKNMCAIVAVGVMGV